MLGADVKSAQWLQQLPCGNALVVMEGVSMYLRPEELRQTLGQIAAHFDKVYLLVDCYTEFAAKASRYKNPVNEVGVTEVYGMDRPEALAAETGLRYVKQHDMTPAALIRELSAGDRIVFSNLYGGKTARSLYRLYEFEA